MCVCLVFVLTCPSLAPSRFVSLSRTVNKNAISAIESRGYNERFIAYMESIME